MLRLSHHTYGDKVIKAALLTAVSIARAHEPRRYSRLEKRRTEISPRHISVRSLYNRVRDIGASRNGVSYLLSDLDEEQTLL